MGPLSVPIIQNYNMKLYLKYMVSLRCKMLVKAELEKLGINYKYVDLGVADVDDISQEKWNELNKVLKRSGIELIEDKKSILIEQMKNVIIELVHYSAEPLSINLSNYLSEKLQNNYNYLSGLFMESHGITIEQFYIIHKVERIKELLIYDELSITEIAFQMHYSSVAHLSNQFKKITGITPSAFKKIGEKRRKTLEDL